VALCAEEKDTDNEYSLWGKRAHKSLEANVKDGTPLIEGITKATWVREMTEHAKEKGGVVQTEQQVAITETFKPTTWFAKDVWCRAVLDLTIVGTQTAFVWDYKTGKQKEDKTQLRLFAGIGFVLWPTVSVIHTRYAWLQTGNTTKETYTRLRQHEDIWSDLLPRVHRLEEAVATNNSPPKPGGLCRFCNVKSCEYNETK